MPSLEQEISEWRTQMLTAGIKSPMRLDELEIHLREEIERQIKSGLNRQNAFELAVEAIGEAESIKREFKKVDAENWNRPLAWAAWLLFAVSFLLPALGDDFPGWKCAGLSATAVTWPGFWHNWGNIHLASMTLANLVMAVSPFLLLRFSHAINSLKWLRFLHLTALVLVCSYVSLLLAFMQNRSDLKIGCYVWTVSFLLLYLSTLKIRNHKMAYV